MTAERDLGLQGSSSDPSSARFSKENPRLCSRLRDMWASPSPGPSHACVHDCLASTAYTQDQPLAHERIQGFPKEGNGHPATAAAAAALDPDLTAGSMPKAQSMALASFDLL
ncbi:hypothetical protein H920_04718 [Fukomys damarensis]|uniref:Uncharacterized protein n=1 Tax=Fukomys damarensis TaxID=885580 RepID=A0A091DNP5_FUKDA|nr:hypothetical protein H920_04718 [Fukomys damarensis]